MATKRKPAAEKASTKGEAVSPGKKADTLEQKAAKNPPPPSYFTIKPEDAAEGFKTLMGGKEKLKETILVSDALAEVKAKAEECTDILVPYKKMRLTPELKLVGAEKGEAYGITQRGFDTLGDWAGVSLKMCDFLTEPETKEGTALAAQVLNYGLTRNAQKRKPDDQLMVRLRGTKVRGVFSDDYANPITNEWVMEVLTALVPGGRIIHSRGDDDNISGLLLIPDTLRVEKGDSAYGGGIQFYNSEVGLSPLSLTPSLFRAVCTNGCVFSQIKGEDVTYSRRHSGKKVDLKKLAEEISHKLQQQIPLCTAAMDAFIASKKIRVDSRITVLRLIEHIGSRNELTIDECHGWAKGFLEEGADLTAFGIVNGLTRSVRDETDIEAVHAEEVAGELATNDEDWWQLMAAQSKYIEDEKLEENFGADVVAKFAGK